MRQFKCVVDVTDDSQRRLEVNVFTVLEDISKEELKELAIGRADELLKESGVKCFRKFLKPVAYKDCGTWPEF